MLDRDESYINDRYMLIRACREGTSHIINDSCYLKNGDIRPIDLPFIVQFDGAENLKEELDKINNLMPFR